METNGKNFESLSEKLLFKTIQKQKSSKNRTKQKIFLEQNPFRTQKTFQNKIKKSFIYTKPL